MRDGQHVGSASALDRVCERGGTARDWAGRSPDRAVNLPAQSRGLCVLESRTSTHRILAGALIRPPFCRGNLSRRVYKYCNTQNKLHSLDSLSQCVRRGEERRESGTWGAVRPPIWTNTIRSGYDFIYKIYLRFFWCLGCRKIWTQSWDMSENVRTCSFGTRCKFNVFSALNEFVQMRSLVVVSLVEFAEIWIEERCFRLMITQIQLIQIGFEVSNFWFSIFLRLRSCRLDAITWESRIFDPHQLEHSSQVQSISRRSEYPAQAWKDPLSVSWAAMACSEAGTNRLENQGSTWLPSLVDILYLPSAVLDW